jgi:alpha-1,2-glucosyltransferase
VLSYPVLKVLGDSSALANLRLINTVAIVLLWVTVNKLARQIRMYRQSSNAEKLGATKEGFQIDSSTSSHIALFPPLFFFSALFYTDVVSALLVLQAHFAFYSQKPLLVFFWSLASLSFRQTNIFWTAVYLAALELQKYLHAPMVTQPGTTKGKDQDKEHDEVKSFGQVLESSWKKSEIYDRRYELATLEGEASLTSASRHC